jgi:hypothetical protein
MLKILPVNLLEHQTKRKRRLGSMVWVRDQLGDRFQDRFIIMGVTVVVAEAVDIRGMIG